MSNFWELYFNNITYYFIFQMLYAFCASIFLYLIWKKTNTDDNHKQRTGCSLCSGTVIDLKNQSAVRKNESAGNL